MRRPCSQRARFRRTHGSSRPLTFLILTSCTPQPAPSCAAHTRGLPQSLLRARSGGCTPQRAQSPRTQQLQRPHWFPAPHKLHAWPQSAPGCAAHTRDCLQPLLCARGGDRTPQRAQPARTQQLQRHPHGILLLASCMPHPAPCCAAHTRACPSLRARGSERIRHGSTAARHAHGALLRSGCVPPPNTPSSPPSLPLAARPIARHTLCRTPLETRARPTHTCPFRTTRTSHTYSKCSTRCTRGHTALLPPLAR